MPRYIDADALLRNTIYNARHVPYISRSDVAEVPTADVVERKDLDEITEEHERIGYEKGYRDGYAQATVEVVRCKECKHSSWDELGKCYWCKGKERTADFFCADGERRDNGEIRRH